MSTVFLFQKLVSSIIIVFQNVDTPSYYNLIPSQIWANFTR